MSVSALSRAAPHVLLHPAGAQVVLRRHAGPGEDAGAHVGVERRGPVLGEVAVEQVRLGLEDRRGPHEVDEAERQAHVDDLGAEAREHLERAVVGGEHLGGDALALRPRHPGEAQATHAAVEMRHRIGRHDPAGVGIEGVGPLDDGVEQGAILDAAGHRPGVSRVMLSGRIRRC